MNWTRLLVVSSVAFVAGVASMAAFFVVLALFVRFGFHYQMDWGPVVWPGAVMLALALGVVFAVQAVRSGFAPAPESNRRARRPRTRG